MNAKLILLFCLVASNIITSQNDVFIKEFIKDLYDLKPEKRLAISLGKREPGQIAHI